MTFSLELTTTNSYHINNLVPSQARDGTQRGTGRPGTRLQRLPPWRTRRPAPGSGSRSGNRGRRTESRPGWGRRNLVSRRCCRLAATRRRTGRWRGYTSQTPGSECNLILSALHNYIQVRNENKIKRLLCIGMYYATVL